MKYRFFTDPHLGRNAATHTTLTSRKSLDKAIYDNARLASTIDQESCAVICGGDLLDKYSNKEGVIKEAGTVALNCDWILSGNHDLSNRSDVIGTLELLATTQETECLFVSVGVSESGYELLGDNVLIPHHSSQDLFDATIEEVVKLDIGRGFVLLHCNYNNDLAQNDSSLNLTEEQAKKLLTRFKYILLGHEHQHRYELDGRLCILGNTHPTSFSDIGDKYFWELDQGVLTKHQIWSKSDDYIRLTVADLLSEDLDSVITASIAGSGKPKFVEVVGESVDPALAPQVAEKMSHLWKSYEANLFMVRNNVQFACEDIGELDKSVQLENLTHAISKKLSNTDLSEVWEEHLAGVLDSEVGQ